MTEINIQIEAEVSIPEVCDDIVKALELILPYMADNVVVTSAVHDD